MLWYLKILYMRSSKINISFTAYTDSNFLTKAGHIATCMGDPIFVAPVPTLAEVQMALGVYGDAVIAAESLGRTNVIAKNQARKALEVLLAQLGRWVMFFANGDLNILGASGYTISKEPQPRHLENPGNVVLANGITSGSMTAAVARGNADSFLHEISDVLPIEATVWTKYPSNNSQFVFTGLTPGKQYWVKVAAVGSRNQVAYSNIGTLFVQ